MGSREAGFSDDVRRNGAESVAILSGIADILAERFEAIPELRDGVAALQGLGLSLVVRLEAQPGEKPLRIAVAGRGGTVPQWTPEDEALLRALGIAHGDDAGKPRRASKPGRHQPR